MASFKLSCPRCQDALILAAYKDEPDEPRPGSTLICWTCGLWSILTPERSPRPVTANDYAVMNEDKRGIINKIDRHRFEELMRCAGGRFFRAV